MIGSILDDQKQIAELNRLAEQIREHKREHARLWEEYRRLWYATIHDQQANRLPRELEP